MQHNATRTIAWALAGILLFALAPAGELAATGNQESCTIHEPIRILEDKGANGFVWDDPLTGAEVYRPGSGVVAGDGTATSPYEITGWCISGADWDPPWIELSTCDFGPSGPDPESTGILICNTTKHWRLHNTTVSLWEHGTALGDIAPNTSAITHTSHQNNTHQIQASQAPGIAITHNMVHGVDLTQMVLIAQAGIKGASPNATIANNTLVGASNLLTLDGDGVHIADNHLDASGNKHIGVTGDGITIVNNTLEHTVFSDPPLSGINVDGDNVLVEGNDIDGYDSAGIKATGGTGTEIAHNQLTTDDGGTGISIGATNVRVHNTTIEDGYQGIQTGGTSTDARIENVTVTGAERGLSAFKSEGTTFTHLNVTGYTEAGLEVDQAENTTVRQTNFADTGGTGLAVIGTSTTVVAEHNWWGCAAGPDDAACDDVVGDADYDPWLTAPNSNAGD